jgi:hypothetical protein
MDNQTGHMIALRPLDQDGFELVPLSKVGGEERAIPSQWICDGDVRVSDGFIRYASKIVGPLNEFSAPLAEVAPAAAATSDGVVLKEVSSR